MGSRQPDIVASLLDLPVAWVASRGAQASVGYGDGLDDGHGGALDGCPVPCGVAVAIERRRCGLRQCLLCGLERRGEAQISLERVVADVEDAARLTLVVVAPLENQP